MFIVREYSGLCHKLNFLIPISLQPDIDHCVYNIMIYTFSSKTNLDVPCACTLHNKVDFKALETDLMSIVRHS